MEAKLIKMMEGYIVSLTGDINDIYAITNKELAEEHGFYFISHKNCQAIENGYDLDELAEKHYDVHIKRGHTEEDSLQRKIDFTIGFVSALEILGNKKFSEEDMVKFGEYCRSDSDGLMRTKDLFNEYQSLQQTEWDCVIEMDTDCTGEFKYFLLDKGKPKLDADGCLILKRK